MIQRALRNITRFPQRTLTSLKARLSGHHGLRIAARRSVRRHLSGRTQERFEQVPGYTSVAICRMLFHLAATVRAEGCILELGSYKGRSTVWLAEAARLTGRPFVTVDAHTGDSLEVFQRVVQQFGIDRVATIHHARSSEVGQTWDQPIALLWIDGAHDYDTVRRDIDDFTPHVAPGGCVVLDDDAPQQFPGVSRAIDQTLRQDPAFRTLGRERAVVAFQRRPDAPQA